MSADDSTSYRPKSPDLSSFFSGPTESAAPSAQLGLSPAQAQNDGNPHHQPHQPQHYSHHNPGLHHHNQPPLNPYLQHQSPAPNHQQQFSPNHQPYDYPANSQPVGYNYGSPSFTGAPYSNPTSPRAIKSEDQLSYLPPGPSSIPISQPGAFPHNTQDHDSFQHQQQPPFAQPYTDLSFPHFASSDPYTTPYHPGVGLDQKPPLDIKPHPQDHAAPMEQAHPPRPPPVNLPDPSPVRTKFPTARIKRIMQADEEVGKVAQQTPIAVGKALEMFMVQLVLTSADVAKEKGSKRVTAQMLKQVVETDEQWDFLRDIVSKVENNEKGGKGGAAKAESDSDDDEPKKKKGGRKRKTG